VSNTLSAYDPIFYAQEALGLLEKSLGMASRVHRGYEKSPQEPGSTITIRKPSTFTAQNAPGSAADVTAESVSISLDQWKEVRFALSDKELAYTTERIIDEHIRPAAYALADQIDQSLVGLYDDIPWYADFSAPAAAGDITSVRKIMFDNKVPMTPGMLHFMVDGQIEKELLDISAFSQHQGAGEAGVDTQRRGFLGQKYGYEFFANQNVPSHVSGVSADAAGAVDLVAGYDIGDTTVHIDGVTDGGTAVVGDIITFTGDTQQYVITAAVTFSGGEGDVAISPPLKAALVNDQVATITLGGTQDQCLAFHRNAFALAMAPLPETGDGIGAQITTINDPVTGLSIRARLYYDGDNSKVVVVLDCLYGMKTLDQNMAVRARN